MCARGDYVGFVHWSRLRSRIRARRDGLPNEFCASDVELGLGYRGILRARVGDVANLVYSLWGRAKTSWLKHYQVFKSFFYTQTNCIIGIPTFTLSGTLFVLFYISKSYQEQA